MGLRGIRGIVNNWINFKRITLAEIAKPPFDICGENLDGFFFFQKNVANILFVAASTSILPKALVKLLKSFRNFRQAASGKTKCMYQSFLSRRITLSEKSPCKLSPRALM